MTFGEAWVAMEQGEKVTNPCYKQDVFYLKDRELIVYDLVVQKEYSFTVDNFGGDIFSDDWEIVKVEETSEELKKENEKLKKENEELKLMVEKSKHKVIQMCDGMRRVKAHISELIDEQLI